MRHFFLVLLLQVFAQLLAAQSIYSVADIPPECLPNANSVVRVRETSYVIEKSDEAEVEEWVVVTIFNKEGASNATWAELDDEFVKV